MYFLTPTKTSEKYNITEVNMKCIESDFQNSRIDRDISLPLLSPKVLLYHCSIQSLAQMPILSSRFFNEAGNLKIFSDL